MCNSKMVLTAFIIFITSINSYSQESYFPAQNGNILTGVDSVDAQVNIVFWDEELEREIGMSYQTTESQIESDFHLGLRRDGVDVSPLALNYLNCDLSFKYVNGLVIVREDLEYYYYNPDGLHILLWRERNSESGGITNFSINRIAQNCVDNFSKEWLKWN